MLQNRKVVKTLVQTAKRQQKRRKPGWFFVVFTWFDGTGVACAIKPQINPAKAGFAF
ncbi:MAG: hypothetical protein LBB76_10760 [Azoarcus sp.]|nr:hypothetical protein [Azoarcus sp.]